MLGYYHPGYVNPKQNSVPYKFTCAAQCKMKKGGGDDSFCFGDHYLVVADGVGGSIGGGIAARHITKMLSTTFSIDPDSTFVCPLKAAVHHASIDAPLGSTTATAVKLSGYTLQTYNIGDSGWMILRYTQNDKQELVVELIARSKPMIHADQRFDCPYQLSGTSTDEPSDGIQRTIYIQEGDVVLLFTDGICDNLFDEEIMYIVGQNKGQLEETVCCIVTAARERMFDNSTNTPFSENAHINGIDWSGGKLDDATVIIAEICKNC